MIDPILGISGITQLYAMVLLRRPGEDWVMSSDKKRLFVTMPKAAQVAIVDTESFKVMKNVDAGSVPVRIALQPDGKYVWVGSDTLEKGKSGVTVIDSEEHKVVAQIPFIYYYMEGMTAPMGSFKNYGRVPRAVRVVDRSLRETAEGVYSARARIPKRGKYDVAFLLDSPSGRKTVVMELEEYSGGMRIFNPSLLSPSLRNLASSLYRFILFSTPSSISSSKASSRVYIIGVAGVKGKNPDSSFLFLTLSETITGPGVKRICCSINLLLCSSLPMTSRIHLLLYV